MKKLTLRDLNLKDDLRHYGIDSPWENGILEILKDISLHKVYNIQIPSPYRTLYGEGPCLVPFYPPPFLLYPMALTNVQNIKGPYQAWRGILCELRIPTIQEYEDRLPPLDLKWYPDKGRRLFNEYYQYIIDRCLTVKGYLPSNFPMCFVINEEMHNPEIIAQLRADLWQGALITPYKPSQVESVKHMLESFFDLCETESYGFCGWRNNGF